MGKILAIDYGKKRIGLAETDDLAIIASPLTTIHSSEIIAFLEEYVSSNQVDCIVVGFPLDLKGQPTDVTEAVNNFVKHLQKRFKGLDIETIDERLTSVMAKKAMLEAGIKKSKRADKGNTDKISAALILQSYLETRN